MTTDLKTLQAQRDAIKGQLNSFDTFLSTFNKETDLIQLQLRLQRLMTVFEKFDSICDNLDVLDDSVDTFATNNTLSNQPTQHNSSGNSVVTNSGTDGRQSTSSAAKHKLKLPSITVPPFDGKVENWLSFKNAFTEHIHKRDDLTDLGRYQCLQSALQGEVKEKLKLFPVSADNYAKAWTHLEKVYGNWRLQISRHLTILLSLPKQDVKNPKSLEILADKAILNYESLKSLGVTISQEIIVQILQERLLTDTKYDWDKSLKRDEFPTLDALTEYMYQRAALQSLSSYETPSESTDETGPPAKVRKPDNKTDNKKGAHAFNTTNKKCLTCSGDWHPLYQCKIFNDMSINEKSKFVKKEKLCVNCLKNHGKSPCRFGGCKTCGKKHNTLLHFPKKNETQCDENSEKSA
ncbi:uncharacterized protein LOC117181162 [Belonocnema kinseyi]|uniref:uncharacterized protein LOC117181162 n=1 Tax=Belonocnema kinseyi TaxID=2817044 RepID=UPI00143D6E70|nr:uncharacterized protein LOC117181162 [Belonocnema kinseyi]